MTGGRRKEEEEGGGRRRRREEEGRGGRDEGGGGSCRVRDTLDEGFPFVIKNPFSDKKIFQNMI